MNSSKPKRKIRLSLSFYKQTGWKTIERNLTQAEHDTL